MTLTINQSRPHITYDGHTATYCTLHYALTGKFAGRFQVLHIDGGQRYRAMSRRPMPAGFTFDDAVRFAVTEQQRSVEAHVLQSA